MSTGIKREQGYKIKYNENKTIRRYLYNDEWVAARHIPEIKKQFDLIDFKYRNTERGKIVEVIAGILARHKKKDNRKKWIPEIDRKGIWLIVMNHICRTNFSLDRLDCTKTYKEGNIVCCCIGCNDRKGSSTPKDWRICIEAEKEMKRINHEME